MATETKKLTKTEKKAEARNLHVQVIALFGKIAGGDRVLDGVQEALLIANRLTRELVTGYKFDGFGPLLGDYDRHGYRPTLRSDLDPRAEVLADLYDFFQARNGCPARAYRGYWVEIK